MPRCGTNFLSNLIQLHPDCAPASPVWEDYLLAHSDLLQQYCSTVADHWDEDWGVDQATLEQLETSLGLGLSRFLNQHCAGNCVVTKTPSVKNLSLFNRFFPRSKLLVLVRDGRSIIESGMLTFGWKRESALQALARAAQDIRSFETRCASRDAEYRVVRYEDLWQNTRRQMESLLDFLDLDAERYDFEQADALPVRGSSELIQQGAESVHWDPVKKRDTFDPLTRFAHWPDDFHYRYNHVVGPHMRHFGYRCKPVSDPIGWRRIKGKTVECVSALKTRVKPLMRPFHTWLTLPASHRNE